MTKPIEIYVDADACPVKAEVYRVAERHGLKVMSSATVRSQCRASRGSSASSSAPGWTTPTTGSPSARAGDVVITADVPLASRGVKAGAAVIAPNGKPFDESAIGMTLATRNLLHELRGAGEITGGPKPFAPGDRSRFFSALDLAVVRWKRAGFGKKI